MQALEKENSQSTPHVVAEASPEKLNIQERHPDWPQLHVSFYFSAHTNRLDMQPIASQLRDADVYLYEDSRHDPNNPDGYWSFMHQTSLNPRLPKEQILNAKLIKDSQYEPIIEQIYNSRKVIDSLDLRKDLNEDRKISSVLLDLYHMAPPKVDSYQRALDIFTEDLELIAKLQERRENIMVGRFEDKISKVLSERPDLKEKPNLNILFSIGAGHTTLARHLTSIGVDVDRNFSDMPYTYSYAAQLQRTFAHGLEPDQELVQRAYTEGFIGFALNEALDEKSIPLHDKEVYKRLVTSKLSPKQMEKVHLLYNEDRLDVESIDELLSNNNLKLPQTREELDLAIDTINANRIKRDIGKHAVHPVSS